MFSKLIRTENHLPFKDYKYSYTFNINITFYFFLTLG